MKPIAKVINNNQKGWTNIVETEPNITLLIGTELYTKEQLAYYRKKFADELLENRLDEAKICNRLANNGEDFSYRIEAMETELKQLIKEIGDRDE